MMWYWYHSHFLKGAKKRPALVLAKGALDVTLAFITSQTEFREVTDLLLVPNGGNGLKCESVLRLSKIATIDSTIVIGKLGEISSNTHKEVNKKLKIIFKL